MLIDEIINLGYCHIVISERYNNLLCSVNFYELLDLIQQIDGLWKKKKTQKRMQSSNYNDLDRIGFAYFIKRSVHYPAPEIA